MTAACTSHDCENPTDLYLCGQCVSDLQAWIDQIPDLLPELDVTIARQDKVIVQQGGGGGKVGSKAPINLDAAALKWDLQMVNPDASFYAEDPEAAVFAKGIQQWVASAELLVSGPEAEKVDHEKNRQRVEDIAGPMPTRKLVPWLRENAGIAITGQMIRHYAHHGYIRPVSRVPLPTYKPHEVLEAYRIHSREVLTSM